MVHDSQARGVGLLDMSGRPANPDTDFFTEKMWDFAPWPGDFAPMVSPNHPHQMEFVVKLIG